MDKRAIRKHFVCVVSTVCVVGRSPWANFVGKKISPQTPKAIFSLQSPQNSYHSVMIALSEIISQVISSFLIIWISILSSLSIRYVLRPILRTSHLRITCFLLATCLRTMTIDQTKSITTSCGFSFAIPPSCSNSILLHSRIDEYSFTINRS